MTIFENAKFWFEILWQMRGAMRSADEMLPLDFIGDGGEKIQIHLSYKKDYKQRCDDTYVREVRYRVGNIFVFDVDFVVDHEGHMDETKFWNTELIPSEGVTEEDCEHVMMCFLLQADTLLPEMGRLWA